MSKFQAPKGVSEYFPPNSASFEYVRDKLLKSAKLAGYELIELDDFGNFQIAGLEIESIFAPGHTKGSVIFTVDNQVLISGDVLFAGGIGRTDLPTGSATDMRKTLRERVLTLPDGLNVLPGHGGQTTIAIERVRNPYLQSDFLDQSGR